MTIEKGFIWEARVLLIDPITDLLSEIKTPVLIMQVNSDETFTAYMLTTKNNGTKRITPLALNNKDEFYIEVEKPVRLVKSKLIRQIGLVSDADLSITIDEINRFLKKSNNDYEEEEEGEDFWFVYYDEDDDYYDYINVDFLEEDDENYTRIGEIYGDEEVYCFGNIRHKPGKYDSFIIDAWFIIKMTTNEIVSKYNVSASEAALIKQAMRRYTSEIEVSDNTNNSYRLTREEYVSILYMEEDEVRVRFDTNEQGASYLKKKAEIKILEIDLRDFFSYRYLVMTYTNLCRIINKKKIEWLKDFTSLEDIDIMRKYSITSTQAINAKACAYTRIRSISNPLGDYIISSIINRTPREYRYVLYRKLVEDFSMIEELYASISNKFEISNLHEAAISARYSITIENAILLKSYCWKFCNPSIAIPKEEEDNILNTPYESFAVKYLITPSVFDDHCKNTLIRTRRDFLSLDAKHILQQLQENELRNMQNIDKADLLDIFNVSKETVSNVLYLRSFIGIKVREFTKLCIVLKEDLYLLYSKSYNDLTQDIIDYMWSNYTIDIESKNKYDSIKRQVKKYLDNNVL